ncbi:glycosylphosphatidylinositol anchor attachment 1 protein-like [Papaver somniferum]|uniref:glycosylphosphatidylinositol anchor attachment 1 protein-like n=1 Tax=Papaver somniferum TaxID=3469 RepID=UPI000E6F84FC|nr:glycosylphosphatidylinositol anchor attachment 1 protein-like [Papaver somniferum]
MENGIPDSQNPKPKPRPIVRIGIFLISHNVFFSVICCIGGILALFLLPLMAKNSYISENALMPGSANPMFSRYDTMEANKLVKDIMSMSLKPEETGIEIARLLTQRMEESGVEVYHHRFHEKISQFRILHFFSDTPYTGLLLQNTSAIHGINTVGIIRAPRGDGKEAIVFVTPYNSTKIELSEALSIGLAYSVFSLLGRVTWLAKDIVWLAADSRYGEYTSVSAWLRDYHTPVFNGPESKENPTTGAGNTDVFRRAGTMAAALVIKVVEKHEETEKDTLCIYAEASNGQMPNLDLINTVHYLAVHTQGLRVKVEKVYCLLNLAWLQVMGQILESVSKVAKGLNSQWKFGMPAAEYVDGTATLASSLYYQAIGVPTGSHGAFRDYQVDAVTLEISPRGFLNNEGRRTEFLLRGGRLMESVVRSVNNLLEKFHQSFFLYLMTSPSKFVSVGVYMIAFLLLLVPLPIAAAALYSGAKNLGSNLTKENQVPAFSSTAKPGVLKSWRWLHAAKVVFIIHLWATIVSLLPSLINHIPEMTPTNNMFIWASSSIFILLILYSMLGSPYSYPTTSGCQNSEWATLKSVMIAVASIGLGLMSIINYATAQIGAIILVPMCLLVHPLKLTGRSGNSKAFSLIAFNLVVAMIGFPPAGLALIKGWSEGFGAVNVGDFWIWAESLWAWNSATYLYVVLIHFPCWVLCMHILLHPC